MTYVRSLRLSALRRFTTSTAKPTVRGTHDAVVIGAFEQETGKPFDHSCLSPGAAKSVPDSIASLLVSKLQRSRFHGKDGQVRLVYDLEVDDLPPVISVVGLGKRTAPANKLAESVRNAAATGVRSIRDLEKKEDFKIAIDPMVNAKAAAEGASLAAFVYNEDRMEKAGKAHPSLFSPGADIQTVDAWVEGETLATAQNLARFLMERPANKMTPIIFAQTASTILGDLPKMSVTVRDQEWAESKGMGSFLSVARGSDEPLKFVEIVYSGGKKDEKPLALVGKGVTFDTGGISIKPSADMASMKGDMGGAAVVLAAMYAIGKLLIPKNVVAVIPLTENMPSGRATKPGDVVKAMNGKTIEVDNTDAEGRLILADAIYYVSTEHEPTAVVELSTLTGAMDVALGYPYAGVFSSDDRLWEALNSAGDVSGDKFWRMPLDDAYKPQITSNVADLKNVGGRGAGSCTAAIFLKEFVPGLTKDVKGTSVDVDEQDKPSTDKPAPIKFAHIDIAGVFKQTGGSGYISKGMTGRPVRSLVEFIRSSQI
ncbi:hypothetical protein HDU76_004128 [Blyttiomyces sp. JEL0837]|nr:hypothetical protein HDU76_004128 [Blyttiomyces sp. JEL0837]